MAAQDRQEDQPELQNYKTWVLKVSIHCEGCKRKVKKILQQVPGVYTIDIDLKQQKAIVTGNVEAEALLRKLHKSGKHAELVPQQTDHKEKKSAKIKSKEKQINPQNKEAESTTQLDINTHKNVKSNEKIAAPKEPSVKIQEASDEAVPKRSEKPSTGSAKPTEETGTASGDKPAEASIVAPAGPVFENHNMGPQVFAPTNDSPPRHPSYHYYPQQGPQFFAPPPAPAYVVSYNTAQPTANYTASYYAPAPPTSYAYTYSGPSHVTEPPPSDVDTYPRQPLDSFEMFSDENPNGCFIM